MSQDLKAIFSRIRQFFVRSELAGLDPQQVQDIARDIGVTTNDLFRLAQANPEGVLLLPERLAAEHISPTNVQAEWPAVWKDMQRLCALCESQGACRHDLEEASRNQNWRNYCPNAQTMDVLKGSLAKT